MAKIAMSPIISVIANNSRVIEVSMHLEDFSFAFLYVHRILGSIPQANTSVKKNPNVQRIIKQIMKSHSNVKRGVEKTRRYKRSTLSLIQPYANFSTMS